MEDLTVTFLAAALGGVVGVLVVTWILNRRP